MQRYAVIACLFVSGIKGLVLLIDGVVMRQRLVDTLKIVFLGRYLELQLRLNGLFGYGINGVELNSLGGWLLLKDRLIECARLVNRRGLADISVIRY